MTFDFKNVCFENEKILIKDRSTNYQINVSDIWTMFYAKWSFENYFTLAYTPSISIGYLYITTKDMKKMTEVVNGKISL